MISRIVSVTGLASILLTACGAGVAAEIIGEWRGLAGHQDLVFYVDGQVEMKSPRHSDYYGNYTIENGNKVIFVFPKLSKPIAVTAHIRGNKMTLVYPVGRGEKHLRK